MSTGIEWTDETWNPTTGCDRVSSGCDNCYALTMAARLKGMGQAKYQRDGDPRTSGPGFGLTVHPDTLDQPLRWRKPRRVFVNSMSDLFHPDVPDEFVVDVLAVISLTPQHTYQVLTKRPQRMAALLAEPDIPGRVARSVDRIVVAAEIAALGDGEIRPIPGWSGYFASNLGQILTEKRGKMRPLSPDQGEAGHQRVTLFRDGHRHREGVHRLVLTTFDRPPVGDEQGCHRDGDPSNNALPNLRWGTQADNWADRDRHGTSQSWSRLTLQEVEQIKVLYKAGDRAVAIADRFGISDTQVYNIAKGRQWAERSDWPLVNLWAGTSIESNRYAFRADHLRATPAAVRFISAEPLLGPLDELDLSGIDWLIVGGESGPGARPMHPDWVRGLRDRCVNYDRSACTLTKFDWANEGVECVCVRGPAFFFKQWGEWTPHAPRLPVADYRYVDLAGRWQLPGECGSVGVWRTGKKAAGRELDGRTWDEYPEYAS